VSIFTRTTFGPDPDNPTSPNQVATTETITVEFDDDGRAQLDADDMTTILAAIGFVPPPQDES
jgi:hypothetical protein